MASNKREQLNKNGKYAVSASVTLVENGASRTAVQELIGEEPFLIRIDGTPYSVVMRTPGDELVHAAGFCLGEGIVDTPDDFLSIGFCGDLDPNVVDIRLKPERRNAIQHVLDRRGFVSQTSCGICGKEMVEDLHQVLTPLENDDRIRIERIHEGIQTLAENQTIYRTTRGSHAAVILDRQMAVLAFSEDVGRHNALDKAIGKAFLGKTLPDVHLLVMSSRISYELVQKAARARIPIMIGLSRPTALAAELGRTLNMTIACRGKGSGLLLVCGEHRIAL